MVVIVIVDDDDYDNDLAQIFTIAPIANSPAATLVLFSLLSPVFISPLFCLPTSEGCSFIEPVQ